MITFSNIVKNEICTLSSEDNFYIDVFLNFYFNNIEIKENKNVYYFLVNNKNVAFFLKELLQREIKDLKIKSVIPKNNEPLKINQKSKIYFNRIFYNQFNLNQIDANDETLNKSIIIAAFLSNGSVQISKLTSSYHFEIRSKNQKYLEFIKKIFEKYLINSKIIKRRSNFILYIKKAESISDILKIMGCIKSMYELEDSRISKDFNNSLQRTHNLDFSNINKTVKASAFHIKMIHKIIETNEYEDLDKNIQLFCKVRLKEPNSSLQEIAEIMNDKYSLDLSKSNVSNYLRKIKSIYFKL